MGPWQAQRRGELWNATGFAGAELAYAELVAAPTTRRRWRPTSSHARREALARLKSAGRRAAGIVGRVRFGILTGGGDCPGLNAVIRAIVRKGIDVHGDEIVGFRDGWRGPLETEYDELTIESTRGILPRGGTILGTSRTNPFKRDDGPARCRAEHEALRLRRPDRHRGRGHARGRKPASRRTRAAVLGVPKTIDNDIGATDVTFGFDTALQVATEAIDRLHTTAESHHRVMVVEVMGRHAGWIALYSGIAGGADVILIPEQPFDIEEVCALIRRRHGRGRFFSIVVAAEGALPKEGTMEVAGGELDEFGHARLGGHRSAARARDRAAHRLRDACRRPRPHSARRHADRVRPRPRDPFRRRARSTRPTTGGWGTMPALRGARIELVQLAEAVAELRTVTPEEFAFAEAFLG